MVLPEQRKMLEQLSVQVSEGQVLTAEENWQGADVKIVTRRPRKAKNSFYPEKRYVVTKYAPELSWLFIQILLVFVDLPEYNGASKIELFGRLANTANRYLKKNAKHVELRDLLLAVLHEAFSILEDIEDETFGYLTLAFGNEILDDHVEQAERRGFLGIEETKQFFAEKGVAL